MKTTSRRKVDKRVVKFGIMLITLVYLFVYICTGVSKPLFSDYFKGIVFGIFAGYSIRSGISLLFKLDIHPMVFGGDTPVSHKAWKIGHWWAFIGLGFLSVWFLLK